VLFSPLPGGYQGKCGWSITVTVFVYLVWCYISCPFFRHVVEQPAENISTQGKRRLRNPKFVVCRRYYGNDQMEENDMDETYSMHGRDE
jgi:hypothetical protein